MTPEELKTAIAEGQYLAFNWLALQVASGKYANLNLSTDADGVVTVPPAGGATPELPEDDPATIFDDSLAAKMGGAIELGKAIELLIGKIDTYYGPVNNTPVTSLADTQFYIKSYFACDDAEMDTAIADYYTYRVSQGRIVFTTTTAFNQYFFCKGANEQAWGQWLVDQSTYPVAKMAITQKLTNALSAEFWSSYFASGSTKPSTSYLDAGCVPIPDQTLLNLLYGVARNTTAIKPYHRYRFKASGYMLDADGDTQDWFWYRTAAGVNTFASPSFVYAAPSNLPTGLQVPWNSSHIYEWTVDFLDNGNNPIAITVNKHASMNATGLTYPQQFNISIYDEGEYRL